MRRAGATARRHRPFAGNSDSTLGLEGCFSAWWPRSMATAAAVVSRLKGALAWGPWLSHCSDRVCDAWRADASGRAIAWARCLAEGWKVGSKAAKTAARQGCGNSDARNHERGERVSEWAPGVRVADWVGESGRSGGAGGPSEGGIAVRSRGANQRAECGCGVAGKGRAGRPGIGGQKC
jgi:hypothetical protein